MSQNGQTYFKNLQGFKNASDHFGTLCIKVLREQKNRKSIKRIFNQELEVESTEKRVLQTIVTSAPTKIKKKINLVALTKALHWKI